MSCREKKPVMRQPPKKLRKLKPVGMGIVNMYMVPNRNPAIATQVISIRLGRRRKVPTIPSMNSTTE